MATAVVCPTCAEAGTDRQLLDHEVLRPLLPAVLPWLVERRWFSHERGCLRSLAPHGVAVLPASRAVLVHALLDARHEGGAEHRYQLLIGLRRTLPAALTGVAFGRAGGGRWDGWWLYEATEDPELMTLLLERPARGEGTATLRLTATRPVPLGLRPRALAVEQSNSTVVYGDRVLLKVLRQVAAGPHPEVEVLRALGAAGAAEAPALLGWLHTEGAEADATVLGVLEEYLAADGDGWRLALRQAVTAISGDGAPAAPGAGFAAEARAIGVAVAGLHAALARALPGTRLGPVRLGAEAAAMERRLRAAAEEVPALEPYLERVRALFTDFAEVGQRGNGLPGQRVHGDLHLGQLLRTPEGWRVIDFEGEPARPIAERRRPQSAFRDVAGMLRSFDYAANQALGEVLRERAGEPPAAAARRSRRAQAWAVRCRRAFLDGYASLGGPDPHCHPVALRAFEADKAVYEAVYEQQHRPDLLSIPLAALQRLVFWR